MTDTPLSKPWYKHPMVWLIILLPAASVVAGVGLLIVALINQDSVVRDDWYKEGKAINQNLARDETAKKLNQTADITIDTLTGEVVITLRAAASLPALQLFFSHPTQANQDQTVVMQRHIDGTFHGNLTHALKGRYYVELSTPEWRLLGDKEFPLESFRLNHD